MPLYTTLRVCSEHTYSDWNHSHAAPSKDSSSQPLSRAARSRASAFSNALRARNSSRSSASPVAPPAEDTSTCSMRGCVATAKGPTTSLFTGTSRKPSTFTPSDSKHCSTSRRASAACWSSSGRKSMPTPCLPSSICGQHSCRSSSKGISHMMPAPSPESLSAEHPPRCSMQPQALMALEMTSCSRTPSRRAISPTPHASRSAKSVSASTAPVPFAMHLTARRAGADDVGGRAHEERRIVPALHSRSRSRRRSRAVAARGAAGEATRRLRLRLQALGAAAAAVFVIVIVIVFAFSIVGPLAPS
mmetsp:Transcript_2512/g.9025  ORF Transcript_2512/g.9025 Transcript_2512/m.9025 type:complete len:303 (+) Transcript_2512:1536-2444(+)